MRISFYDGATKGKREEQEDHKTNLKLANGYYLYVLADGVGGQVGGKIASMTVCAAFRHYFDAHSTVADPRKELLQALNHANTTIQNIIKEKPLLEGMGSTVIALLLHEPTGKFSFISVGDSPLYCLRQQMLIRLNANHAYYEELKKNIAAGKITMLEAEDHPDRHAISSAVMGGDIPFIDQKDGTLLPGECLMLASDGIHTLNDDVHGEIAQILISEKDPESIVKRLLKAVEDKDDPYQDNTTILLLCLNDKASLHGESSLLQEIPCIRTIPLDHGRTRKQRGEKDRSQKKLYWIIGVLCLIIAGIGFCFFWKAGDQTTLKTELSAPSPAYTGAPPDPAPVVEEGIDEEGPSGDITSRQEGTAVAEDEMSKSKRDTDLGAPDKDRQE